MPSRSPFSIHFPSHISRRRRAAAWTVHFFTATGAICGLFALHAISQQQFTLAFWLMGAAVFIDGLDGTLARLAATKRYAPELDGALLDNIIDFLNYVTVPAFFLIHGDLLPRDWNLVGAAMIMLASAYQFSQVDAKTRDHFFKGFPSYWNVVVFYLFIWQFTTTGNLLIVLGLTVLVFVPIKYVYPSRLEYLTRRRLLRRAMLAMTLLWGVVSGLLLWLYPATNMLLSLLSLGIILIYIAASIYRTLVPLDSLLAGPPAGPEPATGQQ